MKKLYLGTNLKMYKTIKETTQYLNSLAILTNDIANSVNLFVLPSYTALPEASLILNNTNIKLGAQNMCWEERGQFTGEISPVMLKELGISIVMVGHSERRHVFGEIDQIENRKIITALQYGFTVILCVGETLEDKNYNISDEVLKRQLKIDLYNVSEKFYDKILIGYEPVWAIGKEGLPATPEYAQQKHKLIKKTLNEIFGSKGSNIPILYGGSVNMCNAEKLIVMDDIDGLYVGRSAWQADDFNRLIRFSKAAFDKKYNINSFS
ncbi:triose-phosphate isomerase family protein [Pectinatus frisingensis]|uniref:triose-phosphate isomerase family protein n=1 Tax=Pectinatus frisingensis TaxID=865 RepID=UPI0015F5DFFA|nr:triose-phosphate isomerase [Pectinatus frisingensis]